MKIITKELRELLKTKAEVIGLELFQNSAINLKKKILKSLALHILLYLQGKSEGEMMKNHPVIKKIAVLKLYKAKLDDIFAENEEIIGQLNTLEAKDSKKKESKSYLHDLRSKKTQKRSMIKGSKEQGKAKLFKSFVLKTTGADDPRKITTQILKNRGYVLPRKKVISRVKHKKKYQKAQTQLKVKPK